MTFLLQADRSVLLMAVGGESWSAHLAKLFCQFHSIC